MGDVPDLCGRAGTRGYGTIATGAVIYVFRWCCSWRIDWLLIGLLSHCHDLDLDLYLNENGHWDYVCIAVITIGVICSKFEDAGVTDRQTCPYCLSVTPAVAWHMPPVCLSDVIYDYLINAASALSIGYSSTTMRCVM